MTSLNHATGFSGVLIKNELSLPITLTERDSDPRDRYKKLKAKLGPVVGDGLLDVAKGVPYLDLATKTAEALIDAFGTNDSDVIFDAPGSLQVKTAGKTALCLRTGRYVLYEDNLDILPPEQVQVQSQKVMTRGTNERIKHNYMILGIQVEKPEPQTAALIKAAD